MCRNIKPLFNFDPPTTEAEVRDAALQFVRKISGYRKPSKVNEAPFEAAVDGIAQISSHLLAQLHTTAPPRDRQTEIAKRRQAHDRSRGREGATHEPGARPAG